MDDGTTKNCKSEQKKLGNDVIGFIKKREARGAGEPMSLGIRKRRAAPRADVPFLLDGLATGFLL